MKTSYAWLAVMLMLGCGARETSEQQAPEAPRAEGFADRCEAPSAASDGSDTTFKFVGGAKQAPFKAVARITLSSGDICSAVLVSKDRLVTSAHCFEGGRTVRFVEFVDSSTSVGQPLQATSVRLHPDYEAALRRKEALATSPGLAAVDVAVLMLAKPVTDRSPAVMGSIETLASGKLVALVGYGDSGTGAGTKRFAQSHVGRFVVDETVGGVRFSNLMLLNSSSGTGACPGDSGGGVFVKDGEGYALVGFVNGVNDLLYPGFPISTCERCPRGIGIVTRAAGVAAFLAAP